MQYAWEDYFVSEVIVGLKPIAQAVPAQHTAAQIAFPARLHQQRSALVTAEVRTASNCSWANICQNAKGKQPDSSTKGLMGAQKTSPTIQSHLKVAHKWAQIFNIIFFCPATTSTEHRETIPRSPSHPRAGEGAHHRPQPCSTRLEMGIAAELHILYWCDIDRTLCSSSSALPLGAFQEGSKTIACSSAPLCNGNGAVWN